MTTYLTPIGRLLLSIIFIYAGIGKLSGAEGFSQYLASFGFPAPLVMAYLVGAFEALGGLCVLLGFQVRVAGILLGLFCIATGLMAHLGETTVLMKNLAMAGGFFVLAGQGAGALAIDRAPRERRYG